MKGAFSTWNLASNNSWSADEGQSGLCSKISLFRLQTKCMCHFKPVVPLRRPMKLDFAAIDHSSQIWTRLPLSRED